MSKSIATQVELVKLGPGDYETPDHRWRIRRNNRKEGCAPMAWWLLYYRSAKKVRREGERRSDGGGRPFDGFMVQAITLAKAREFIAEWDEPFAKGDAEEGR
ncbi:hypothetical protein [Mycobacterium sp. M23085]|uniref:hypothetical protein n=1 Tax=Mycobacterium sp. M23085 TaxID=3378087 RepID=UPI003877B945